MKRDTTLLVIVMLFASLPICTHAYSFYRDLKVGDSGEDVRALQQLLNENQTTQVASDGPGAPGQETSYFGEKTKAAVARLQELYASKVLTPLGLSAGTGYVGSLTRSLLATVGSSETTGGQTPQNTDTNPYSGLFSVSAPRITSISPTSGGVGTVVTITGSGFDTKDNTVASLFESFDHVASPDGKTLQITIKGPFPKDFMEKRAQIYKEKEFKMEYELLVRNAAGKSNFMPFTFMFY